MIIVDWDIRVCCNEIEGIIVVDSSIEVVKTNANSLTGVAWIREVSWVFTPFFETLSSWFSTKAGFLENTCLSASKPLDSGNNFSEEV